MTPNNTSGLLCRSRSLRFIEDQLSLKNGIVKNTSQTTSGKINGVLGTYLQETLGGQENPLQKTREKGEKKRGNLCRNQAQKLHDLPTKPKKKTINNVDNDNNNKRNIYIYII